MTNKKKVVTQTLITGLDLLHKTLGRGLVAITGAVLSTTKARPVLTATELWHKCNVKLSHATVYDGYEVILVKGDTPLMLAALEAEQMLTRAGYVACIIETGAEHVVVRVEVGNGLLYVNLNRE